MRLVHDEQPDAALQQRQQISHEVRVGQPLPRYHEQIKAVARERCFYPAPFVHVLAVDGSRAHAEFLRGEQLVAHSVTGAG